MTAWQLYWLTRLDEIKDFELATILCVGFFSLVCGIAWGAHSAYAFPNDERDSDFIKARSLKKYFLRGVIALLAAFLVFVVTPSSNQMAFIVVAPKLYSAVSQNKEIRELPTKVVELANAWIEELKPEKEK